ncbi:HECT-domain-containing protein [Obba rivulosa]|uniref:HECT-type E3 ubiquitin transferase n=1 Tax=Obba rivulosa TaxID=1052685 RepID=A0A8E2AUN3_9APHY|nr:HECT-domain-containing protein [Obba rivulosa]
MIPVFGDDPSKRRREINLGGTHSATSYSDILEEAKARRTQRQDQKRRHDSAVRIQAWWRGISSKRELRRQLRQMFQDDITGLNGLRCLVLLGDDEEALGMWSESMQRNVTDTLLHHEAEESWRVLLRKISFALLCSVSRDPQSQHALAHLAVLKTLLAASAHRADYTQYLLQRGLYEHLRRAILNIPVDSKSSPSLPDLIDLATLPLTIQETAHQSFIELIVYIISIPLLPNRITIALLTTLSARFPITELSVLAADIPAIIQHPPLNELEPRIHLLANIVLFTAPRYRMMKPNSLIAYLDLCTRLLSSLPTHALDPPEDESENPQSWADGDDDDEDAPHVAVVESFERKPTLPKLDSRTRTRLQTLPHSQHISALLQTTQFHPSTKLPLIAFCFALTTVWPTRRDRVLSTVIAWNGGGLVREIYRNYVRSSVLGRDDSLATLMDPANAELWPPLVFLADLYTQALLTMGDDEFFSTGALPDVPRNPLTLDELASFSRKLLNIAFTLYWREDPTNLQEGVPGLGEIKWEQVREKLTKCLQAIHARDSRRPFTVPDHWLVTSQVDMVSFIEAAVFEERQLAQPEGSRPLSKRQISYMSPRLGVLNNIPFAIPFETRVSIFRSFIANDAMNNDRSNFSMFRHARTRVTVRRGSIAQDGFDKLSEVNLKEPIYITFIDQFGNEEAGIDGGGVFKEFLTSLCKEVFDTDRGLWLANKNNELYPNPHSYAVETHSLNWYRFIGRILGKALYEGILIDVAFAGFFLAKWLGKQSYLDDLASLDPELYTGLLYLKHYTGNPEDLSLNFTISLEEFGVTKTYDLIPNGSNIAVTRENRLQYIYLVSHFRLTKQIKRQSEAFFEGLSELIDPKWIRMFNQQELQILLGGVNSPIDLDDLRKHTQYGGVYDDKHPTIEMFWNVVNSFDHDTRRKLLRFATSCSRPPLLGFKELVPNFAIRDAGGDEARLPTASTCVNLLKLPRYSSERILREKLLQAVNSNAGFDLS